MSGVTITIQNQQALRDKFGKLITFAGSAVDIALERAARKVQAEAISLIKTTSKTGHKWKNLPNKSSAPGEPPATQSGKLATDVLYWKTGNQWKVGVKNGAESSAYASYLEYGTERMKPRPFMRPAFWNVETEISEIIKVAWKATLG